MSTTLQRFLSALTGATLVLAVAVFPAVAHNVGPAGANSGAATATTATGAVNVLTVDNPVTGLTLRYLGLRQDDGHSIALVGTGLDSLARGDRIAASGSLSGNVLRVASFTRTGNATQGKATAQSTPVQLQGTLLLYHLDFFNEGRGEYGLAIQSADGKKTLLNVAVIPDTLQPFMKIVASGTLAADAKSLDVTDITVVALPPLRPSDVTADATTNNVLVMPIKFSDSPGDSFTPDQINTEFQNKVAPYYAETSYGQHLLNVTVACSSASMPGGCAANTMPGGWLRGSGTTPTGCDYTTMHIRADAAATAAGYNVNSYQNRYYVLPANSGCGWAGLAYVGFGEAYSANVNALWVYGHELGHNFGLYHAGSMGCGSQVIGGSCGTSEYGDPFDVMGNIRQMHFNAMQKQLLNWIPSTSVKTHSSGTQTYQLSPLEVGGQSTYAVKVPTTDSTRTYWIEFRQPIGFDSPLSTLPNLGAQIRVESTRGVSGDDTLILDLTPGDGNFDNGTLLATAPSYVDSSTGLTISVNSATGGSSGLLSVTVAMGGRTTTTTTLGTSGSPANPGVAVTFTATVVGNAPTTTVAFTDGGSAISGCAGVALTGSGNTRTAACTTSGLAAGTHSIVATYAGDGNNNPSNSATLSQVINAVATTNFALASNGGVASASSSASVYLPPSSVVNNDRKGLNWGNGGGWSDGTPNAYPDWISVNFNGMKSISSVVVYTVQDNFNNPVEPTDTMTFSTYGVTDFAVQAWVGNAWQTVATVSGNNLVKKTLNFAAVTTDRIRIYITGAMASSSRIVEIEAWGVSAGKTNTTTTLGTSGSPANPGVAVTFTATVVGNAPTTTVAFTDGGSAISGCAGVALTGSGNTRTAACTTSGLAAGTHSIVATYAGDGNNNPSNSATLSQVINAVATTNFALASNGGAAFASSSASVYLPPSSVVNNDRKGLNWGNGGGWSDGTPNAYPDWISVNFNGMKSISSVVVYTVQDNFNNPVEPTDTMTFSTYGVTDFAVQAWVGNAWQTVATVSGNNLVKKTLNFAAVTTDRIRIYITGAMASSSRIVEIEAWGVSAGNLNVASVRNGGVASASSIYYTGWLPIATINDSERAGMDWGLGNGWADGTPNAYPDWVQIQFSGQRTISSVVVYTVQDASNTPSDPTDTMTFTIYGITDFNVQYWNGASWVTVGSVTSNNLVKKTFSFAAVTTDRIRVNINNALASSSRITEVEAWGN